jgi:3-phosphoshikimate 1-carboxyvinyltransferase
MGTALQKLGIKLEIWKDGLKIQGQSTWQGGEVDSGHDHRVAMALVVASVRATAPIIVQHTACIATSFPDFLSCAKQLGLTIELD